jgi:aspartate 1-decarboxylase
MIRLPQVRFGLALVVALGLAMTASADEAKGTIKSIFADKNEIVVKGTVSDTTYTLTKDARVWCDGKECKIADLKENDKVVIDYVKTGDRYNASEVRGLRKAQETTGTVRGVVSEKRELVIKGVLKDTTYHLEKDGTVWVNGKKAELADLREGDPVRVTYEQRGEMLAAFDIFMTKKR